MPPITILKLDHTGRETFRYQGELLERSEHVLRLQAFFNRTAVLASGLLLKRGDRFVETYYDDRWYNIFEIRDGEAGELKGWYCNIGRPAEFGEDQVAYRDLALDLVVFPDGRQIIADEDEFAELPLDVETRQQAQTALVELQQRFHAQFRDSSLP